MSKGALTPKREKFAQGVASGKTQAEAYRQAFSVAKATPKSVQELASRLMADVKVRSRVEELRKPIAEAVGITLESHLRDLLALRNLAAKEKQLSAAISAEVARGKAAGVVVDRAALELTGKNGGPLQSVSMTQSEFAAIAAKVAAGI
jgi:phage terminase small subunit